jgi:hypothetical protein
VQYIKSSNTIYYFLSNFWKYPLYFDVVKMLLKAIPLVNPLNVLCVDPSNVSRCTELMANVEYSATDFTFYMEINILVSKILFPGDCRTRHNNMHSLALLTTYFKFHTSRTGLYHLLLIVYKCLWESAKTVFRNLFFKLYAPRKNMYSIF